MGAGQILLLPEMHERYFYLAEVLTVLAAFVAWHYALPALGIQFASTTTYLNYLRNHSVFPLRIAAAVALASALGAMVLLVMSLRRGLPPRGLSSGGEPGRTPGGAAKQ